MLALINAGRVYALALLVVVTFERRQHALTQFAGRPSLRGQARSRDLS